MFKLLLPLALLATASVAHADVTVRQLSDTELSAVQKNIADRLRDPDSAKFRNIIAVTGHSGKIGVCGEVNAKNGLGGYSGFTYFYGSLTDSNIVVADSQEAQIKGTLWCLLVKDVNGVKE